MPAAKHPCHLSPISESPWFWLYLFATAGLIALMLAGPRYNARQVQLERNLQGRQRAAQVRGGQVPQTPLTPDDRPQIRLTPLYETLAVLLVLGWVGLWYSRLRRASSLGKVTEEEESPARGDPDAHSRSASCPGSLTGAENSQ